MIGLTLEYKDPTNAEIQFTMEGGDNAVAAFNSVYNRSGPVGNKGFNSSVRAGDIARESGENGSWKSAQVSVLPTGSSVTSYIVEGNTNKIYQ